MNALEQLNREKDQVLSRISEAARKGRVEDVLRHCARLERTESLIHRYTGLVHEIDNLSRSDETTNDPQPYGDATKYGITREIADSKTGREIGRIIRETFVDKLFKSGIELRQAKDTIYRTSLGNRVGIAVATERQPDRWFLGLTKGSFDHAVLLCHSEKIGTLEICLPKEFFAKYGNRMSTSNSQMLFNVARKGNTFSILVPGTNGISASEFLGKYGLLR
jgi:hypothetical protein